ncbi:ankyrin repeat domain-containing protein [Candidatus Babela massiliensis]|uniref:Ankyrin repeats containing protein n=1 Tax=Candidatus Babela massiliensis TaxID=673862 RepID=V6DHK1_9BACT|nr:ankyrin repeat domain-containing protein [Candidatus Babela massiliensis]CDK31029.1 Ankyrin repeats containing protein [Candidatus Babela massiliensis]
MNKKLNYFIAVLGLFLSNSLLAMEVENIRTEDYIQSFLGMPNELWSDILEKAIIGDLLKIHLDRWKSDILTFNRDFNRSFPKLKLVNRFFRGLFEDNLLKDRVKEKLFQLLINKIRKENKLSQEELNLGLLNMLNNTSRTYQYWQKVMNLIIAGANINLKNMSGNTALMIALCDTDKISMDDTKSMYLFPNAKKQNPRDLQSREEAIIAKLEAAKLLIEMGADINLQSSQSKSTPLIYAVENGNRVITAMLIAKGVMLDSVDEMGDTALIKGLKNKYAQISKLLISSGANVNAEDKYGKSALMYASEIGYFYKDETNKDIINLLIEKGAKLNHRSRIGDTALIAALKNQHVEIAKLLIERGADINIADREGKTPLMNAISKLPRYISLMLIERGAQLDCKDEDGNTALIISLQCNQTLIAKLLIEKEVDINIQDRYGDSALMLAIQKGYEDIVKMLIEKEANLNLKDEDGNTALIIAKIKGYTDIMKILQAKGAIH